MKNVYEPKKTVNRAYNCIILIVVILTVLRWANAFNSDIVVVNQEINSHISNFSLSLLVVIAIGYSWLLQGIEFWKIVLLGIMAGAANIICETMMGFMNTPDIIDAVYGIVGTATSLCFLLYTKLHGLTDT